MLQDPNIWIFIFLPVSNYESGLASVVNNYQWILERLNIKFELCLLPYYSTDTTISLCADIEDEYEFVRTHPSSEFYGGAVKTGMDLARGQVWCWADIERTTSLQLLYPILHYSMMPNPDAVVKVCRRHGHVVWNKALPRRLWNWFRHGIMNLDIDVGPVVMSRAVGGMLRWKADVVKGEDGLVRETRFVDNLLGELYQKDFNLAINKLMGIYQVEVVELPML